MKLTRCPTCHHAIHLESAVQDQAGRELLATVAKLNTSTASLTLAYLALFRPQKSDLSNGRALKLLNEVLVLTPNENALIQALEQTTANISATRATSEEHKPLTNHNYLKKVLQSIPGWNTPSTLSNSHEISTSSHHRTATSIDDALLSSTRRR